MDRLKEFINEQKLKIILTLLAVIVGLMVILFIVMGQRGDSSPNSMSNETNPSARSLKSTDRSAGMNTHHYQSTFIDVEGAVKRPGVYQFTNNMRIDDAVNLAGGLNRSADRKHIDLAKKLVDQQTVYIPIKGEIKGLPASSDSSSSGSTSSSDSSGKTSDGGGKVNLNTADAKQLESVNGIGEKRAEKIIDYRKSHGNFKQIDDLKKISGIGDKFLSNIKDHVTV